MSTLFAEPPVRTVGLTVNAPTVFAREDFLNWLNDPSNRVFTWHEKGDAIAYEYSDIVVLVDSGYEGSSSDMPEDIWRAICDLVYAMYGGPEIPNANRSAVVVRLTNLAVY